MSLRMKESDEDEIESSRAPLLDHLAELRTRLMIAMLALVIAFIGCFIFVDPIFKILTDPFVEAAHRLHPDDPTRIEMVNTSALGFFAVKMKVSLFAAIVVSFPILAWQAYAFVAPGLYRRERAAVAPFLIAAPVMFLLGAAFVYYVAMPFTLIFALGQQGDFGPVHVQYLPKVDEYVGLETTLVLAFGLFFQLPVVLALLGRIGVVSSAMLRKTRKYALVGVAAFAALVTPPDVLSMTVMTIPLYMVFEASIWLVWLIERTRSKREAAEAAQTQAAE